MTDINFSIIIPHRNIHTLLQRCIDSIPARDDVQIIIVDDNSDPNIVDFDNFPGKNNPQVEIYLTKEGKGAGYARNVGLDHAKGKWLLFADADDYFSENLNKLFDEYLNANSDVIYLLNDTFDQKSGKKTDVDSPVGSACKIYDSNSDLYNVLRYKCYAPWTKMVKRDMIVLHNIRFDEVKASNDAFFSVKTGYYAAKIEVCPYIVYNRIIRQGSLQYSIKKDLLLDRIKVGYSINNFLGSIGKIKYYNNIRSYIAQLREISTLIFLQQLIIFIFKSQPIILKDALVCFVNKFRHL